MTKDELCVIKCKVIIAYIKSMRGSADLNENLKASYYYNALDSLCRDLGIDPLEDYVKYRWKNGGE